MADEQEIQAITERAAKIAAFDQEQAEWGDDAGKIALFWRTLKEAGIPDDLAGPLVINAQVNYYNTDTSDDDD